MTNGKMRPACRLAGRFVLLTLAALILTGNLLNVDSVRADNETRHFQTAGWVGSNYTPAYAVNAVQLWHDFRPDVIEKELAAAQKYYGLSTLRVYLHNIVFDAEKEKMLQRIEKFLKICDKYGIKPGFTFFDDCWNRKGITLESAPPIKGRHNGRWAACPQDAVRTEENLPKFKAYIQEVIRPHRTDKRVLWWEIYNEPKLRTRDGQKTFSFKLRELGYKWAKELTPVQPVIACWDDHPWTDIVDAHNYSCDWNRWNKQTELNLAPHTDGGLAKGAVFTEAGARWYAPRPSNGEPVEVIRWLESRKAANKYAPGVYLCWELMVGNSNCRWYWGTKDNTPEPTVPWCGLMWPDCTPVSLAEAEAIRHYVTGEKRALFFEDFQSKQEKVLRTEGYEWATYKSGNSARDNVLPVGPYVKKVVGDTKWSDIIFEGVVMLREGQGNAGLIFRVNNPGPGKDQMQGYYVGFDTQRLYLGKMNNNWQPLAHFDLSGLDCKVVPGVWNQIRIAIIGNRIKIWFNRMHPSADSDRGLRIDFTDDKNPIQSGRIGVRTTNGRAWFDNLIVLPAEACSKDILGASPNAK